MIVQPDHNQLKKIFFEPPLGSRSRYGFTLVELMIIVAIIGLLAALLIPNGLRAFARVQRQVCIENLRQLDRAKQQWALESGQAGSATPSEADIAPYLNRSGSTAKFVCPADPGHGRKNKRSFDTSYRMNEVTNAPTCKIDPTHEFP